MADLEKDPVRAQRPARRPIPLPPSSLRPPPRVRKAGGPSVPEGAPPASAVLSREGKRGTRRGFLIGLGVPLLGFLIVGALVLRGGLRGTVPDSGPDVLVRARVDQGPAGPGTSPAAQPEPVSAGTTSPPAQMEAAPTDAPTGAGTQAVPETPAGGEGLVSIQVASFRTTRRARAVLDAVSRRTGLPGVILPTTVDGVRWQRILLGAFASEAEARTAARPLLQDGTIGDVLIRPVPERSIPELTGGASP